MSCEVLVHARPVCVRNGRAATGTVEDSNSRSAIRDVGCPDVAVAVYLVMDELVGRFGLRIPVRVLPRRRFAIIGLVLV